MKSDLEQYSGKIIFALLSATLLIGFYFNEDSAGSGGFIADFENTWAYVEVLKESIFVLPWGDNHYVGHTPLHFIILSKIYILIDDKYLIRLIFCIISILMPLLFYVCLKINYPNVNKNNLLVLASLVFLFPSFRAGAIWGANHITALFFFLLFLVYYLKWIRELNFKKLTLNIYLQTIFLALAVYSRQYYALIFVYCMYVYFRKFDLLNFLKLSLFVSILTIPGFLLIYFDPYLVTTTWDAKFHNSFLINSSILSFYLIPIFFIILFTSKEKLSIKKNQQLLLFLISIIIILFLSFFYEYNHKIGGGYFLKLSYLITNTNILFLITSAVGVMLLLNLMLEDKHSILLIFLLILGFSAHYIFQKYFEPMFFFILFLMIKSSFTKAFLNDMKNIYFLFFYLSIYLTTAIVNDLFQITKQI